MRIVQLLPELQEGGVERGVVELNRELVARGIESFVLSCGGKLVSRIEEDGGTHIAFDLAGKNPFSAPHRALGLRKALSRIRPDVVHARSRVPAWLAYFANGPLGIPFVTTVHGFNSVNPYSRIMTRGEKVICVSTAIRDYIRMHYGIAPEKTVVIPRGVDLDRFDPRRLDETFMEEFREKFALQGRFVVAAVGRITQLKDHETFIRAVAAARQSNPDICGLIVGGVREDKEGYFRQLRELVADLGAEDLVRFAGSQSKVAEIYALSDVVVSSSKKPESFGRSAAEAIAMGVPVVASGHGGIVDIVREGISGYLFKPGDATMLAEKLLLARAHRDVGMRELIAGNFSLEQMVEKTLNVYREVSDSSKARARRGAPL